MLPCKSKQTDTCLHRKCSGHSVQRLCKYAHMISYIVIPYYIIRFKLKLLAKLIHCTLRSAPHRILQPGQRELQAGANTLAERNGFGLALAIPLHIHSSPALKDVPKQLPTSLVAPQTPRPIHCFAKRSANRTGDATGGFHTQQVVGLEELFGSVAHEGEGPNQERHLTELAL